MTHDIGHREWLPNPRLFPTQGGFRKRDLRCSTLSGRSRGHLTYHCACTKIRVRLQEVVFFPIPRLGFLREISWLLPVPKEFFLRPPLSLSSRRRESNPRSPPMPFPSRLMRQN